MRIHHLFVPLFVLELAACGGGGGVAATVDAGLDSPDFESRADAQPDWEVETFPDVVESPSPDAGGGQADAASCTTAVDTIINDARSHLGKGYKYGAEGPDQYDCSGLVYAVFKETGYFSIIGNGSARTVGAIAAVFRARGDEDTVNLVPGDLITFGSTDGYPAYEHIGIYEGKYDQDGHYNKAGWIVNALNEQTGVVENKVDALIPRVQTYLHTHLAELPCK